MNARSLRDLAPPLLFGLGVLVLWEAFVRLAGGNAGEIGRAHV